MDDRCHDRQKGGTAVIIRSSKCPVVVIVFGRGCQPSHNSRSVSHRRDCCRLGVTSLPGGLGPRSALPISVSSSAASQKAISASQDSGSNNSNGVPFHKPMLIVIALLRPLLLLRCLSTDHCTLCLLNSVALVREFLILCGSFRMTEDEIMRNDDATSVSTVVSLCLFVVIGLGPHEDESCRRGSYPLTHSVALKSATCGAGIFPTDDGAEAVRLSLLQEAHD
jgi:hypothetical protein